MSDTTSNAISTLDKLHKLSDIFFLISPHRRL